MQVRMFKYLSVAELTFLQIKCELCSKTFASKNSVRKHKIKTFASEVGIMCVCVCKKWAEQRFFSINQYPCINIEEQKYCWFQCCDIHFMVAYIHCKYCLIFYDCPGVSFKILIKVFI